LALALTSILCFSDFMNEYHKHVLPGVKLDFAALWKGHAAGEYDAWQSRDPRQLRLRLAAMLVADWDFPRVLDVGCGTGNSTWYLKRQNNWVVGIDIDENAIKLAKHTYKDMEFCAFQGSKRRQTPSMLKMIGSDYFDLVCFQGVLAYVPGWKAYLQAVDKSCLIAEYVPPGSKGCVPSVKELTKVFGSEFKMINHIVIDGEIVVMLGTRK
jgi:SAM-dependent methyltransferase